MKLFISYSRDDKAWVFELWRALRDRAHHDAWLDQCVVPAQDWWETILENLEACEAFIYVLTPKSAESIFCRAEVEYALALNKPILPLLLKPCDYPQSLKKQRIQYHSITDDSNLSDVLFVVTQGLSEIRVARIEGNKYAPPATPPTRPPEPLPTQKPEQLAEVFMLAEEAAAEGNFSLAEKLFQQVIDADGQGWGLAAAERLGELRHERARGADYLSIVQMAANPALVKGARAAWRVYIGKYGADYDPNGMVALLSDDGRTTQASSLPTPPPPQIRSRVPSILPAPFAWIDIPAGQVTLVNTWDDDTAVYLKKNQPQTFSVPAFAIAKYPLTNGQYAPFIEAGGYGQKKWWTEAGWQTRESEQWTEPRYWRDAKWNQADCPVVGVSWYEAVAYCAWLSEMSGERIGLPTEQQWQRAAQGDSQRAYPWGEEWDCQRCNNSVSPCFSSQTTAVTAYEGRGDSPLGVVDMSGNVWEWCATDYNTGDKNINKIAIYRVRRGGSWGNLDTFDFRADARYRDTPRGRSLHWGFRLALS
jgi:formylglycine-generating enzyme required for sulfatase activity